MRTLEDKIYADKKIYCRKCSRYIGQQTCDAQILILESGLICFNYLSWQCECGKNGSFVAPLLPNEAETPDNLYPDVKEISDKSKKLASVGVSKVHRKYRARVSAGNGKTKYLGLFPTEEAARDAVLKAKSAKQ